MTDRSRPVVLVVDDWSEVAELVARLLTYLGYAPLVAANGVAAVEALRHDPRAFAAAVVDVQMPQMDGPTTLDALRELAPGLPCVFLSAGSGRYTGEELLARGSVALLRKPMSLDELGNAIAKVLASGRPLT